MTTDPLEDLPSIGGFRMRGMEMTRIEVFTDAAFAFAVTLLVVSIDAIPSSYEELVGAMQGVPAFIISFALLFMFWNAHNDWSRRYGLDDFPTIVLSAGLVLLVMIYVYPLKMMSHGIVNVLFAVAGGDAPGEGQFSGIELTSGSQLQGLFLIYGLGFVALSGTILGCYAHAFRLREALNLNAVELYDTRVKMTQWTVMVGVGAVSCVVALLIPGDHPIAFIGLPGWVYMSLSFLMPWLGIRAGRERRKFLPAKSEVMP